MPIMRPGCVIGSFPGSGDPSDFRLCSAAICLPIGAVELVQIAGNALLDLPHAPLQAGIDRERFTADQPSRDAHRHYALKHPPQSITLSKALVPRAAEHRMIGDCVLDPELAKPPVGQIDFNLSANPPL